MFSLFRPATQAATGRPTEALYGRAGRLVRCVCGFVRQDPPVEVPYEESEDPEHLREAEGIRVTAQRMFERIEQYRRPPGVVLDVGCGPGLAMEVADARGWEAIGLELSGWAVREGRRRGLDIRQVSLEESGLRDRSVAAVVLNDVIEHVPDPVRLLRRLADIMEPGAVLFCATPDVDSVVAKVLRRWWWSVLPNHIYLFSTKTLTRLISTVGLEVVEVTRHPKTFSVDYYLGRLVGYSGGLSRAARMLVRSSRDRLISPNFRDRVAVVARSPRTRA